MGHKTKEFNRKEIYLSWFLSISIAILYFQTLFFKFSGAEESVYIFSKLGAEPVGRIGSAIAELLISILILFPKTRAIASLLSIGIISGAVLSHVFLLGIEILGDHGLLFFFAMYILISSAILTYLHREELIVSLQKIRNR